MRQYIDPQGNCVSDSPTNTQAKTWAHCAMYETFPPCEGYPEI